MQYKMLSKKQAKDMIDSIPEAEFLVLTYDIETCISDTGVMKNKKECVDMAEEAKKIILANSNPLSHLDLHGCTVIHSIYLLKNRKTNKCSGKY